MVQIVDVLDDERSVLIWLKLERRPFANPADGFAKIGLEHSEKRVGQRRRTLKEDIGRPGQKQPPLGCDIESACRSCSWKAMSERGRMLAVRLFEHQIDFSDSAVNCIFR